MACLTGMGLTSLNRFSISSRYCELERIARPGSPEKKLSQMSCVSRHDVASTEITPSAPRASAEAIWSSLPE